MPLDESTPPKLQRDCRDVRPGRFNRNCNNFRNTASGLARRDAIPRVRRPTTDSSFSIYLCTDAPLRPDEQDWNRWRWEGDPIEWAARQSAYPSSWSAMD